MFPWLRWCCGRWLVNRTRILKITDDNIEEIKGLVQGLKDTLNPQDLRGFVDSFLVRQQEESDQPGSYFHNNNLHFTVFSLFAAGTDTIAGTLRWGLLLMAKYPHIQDQVQEELSQIIGEREPRLEDRRNLPYTDAVIHEIQRWAHVVPISNFYSTSCDVTFQGHFIKKGTTVTPLLMSVLQDEEEWEIPHSFNPGHFLDEKGCFIRKDAFMPFSAGQRACPGESLARMELFLFFTFLLQRFRFSPPSGVSEDELDLTPYLGLTLNPSPHQLCALYNMFPWLHWCCGRWLVNRTRILKITDDNIEEIKGLVQGLKDTLNPQDLRGFVDSFLVRQQEESDQPGSYFHNNNLHFTVFSLFAAGTDTIAGTLRWGLLLMAKYPHIQDQVQEELSQIIGEREPRLEDRRNLPYTDAVIHEIQRWAHVVPISNFYSTSCDVTFQGHFIKKGTTVTPLLMSVLKDEEEWETPHSFNPGHFLDEKGCFIRRDAFMPFSAGRRACVGESLTRTELFLFFTFLLQRFRFSPPPGVSEDELDLTPYLGLTLTPSPHQLCAVSRV
ncbi:hypothetical protein SKAU_G00116320 [Synaphobranchus kaupii]|uniref:Cytochrome P450 n=1 Tax=Synaphobranchus kaupii TaxID=118154 RepID=A0A9Q1FMN4_SYNKA|nr:hypothetical protein SKAU_G00116320 [Synaphobranchus kaupii]